jgi:hypothetical protein
MAALVATNENDTLVSIEKIGFYGKVKSAAGQKVKGPVTISIFKDSSINFVFTDEDGQFKFSNEDLLTSSENGHVGLVLNDNKSKAYSIQIADPYQKVLQSLIDSLYRGMPVVIMNKESTKQTARYTENITMLNPVVITSKSSNGNRSLSSAYHANACGDFVCVENNLNCPVHKATDPGSHLPVKGKTYKIALLKGQSAPVGIYTGVVVYTGCTAEELNKQVATTMMKGIQTIKDFYMPIENDIQQPARTTLYWESLRELNSGEKYDARFSSGSTAGTFTIIVQGIFNNEPIFQEMKITVR